MKPQKIRELTDAEIKNMYFETKKQLFELEVKIASGDSGVNPHEKRKLRREIAKILTIMGERNINP